MSTRSQLTKDLNGKFFFLFTYKKKRKRNVCRSNEPINTGVSSKIYTEKNCFCLKNGLNANLVLIDVEFYFRNLKIE